MSKTDHTWWPRFAIVIAFAVIILWNLEQRWKVPITIEWDVHEESTGDHFDFVFFYGETSRFDQECPNKPVRLIVGWDHCYDEYVEVDRNKRAHTFWIRPGAYYFTASEYRGTAVSEYSNERFIDYWADEPES